MIPSSVEVAASKYKELRDLNLVECGNGVLKDEWDICCSYQFLMGCLCV